jgi:hypothetical protein
LQREIRLQEEADGQQEKVDGGKAEPPETGVEAENEVVKCGVPAELLRAWAEAEDTDEDE